ncbi:GTPase-activating protein [Mortierella antarctica]|nr:GTPase-activating protein [Mortierella antarctica]
MFEQKSQRLMAACAEGNLELVNRIASKFESPEELCEAEPSTGYTPLMMAARHGHLDVVEALIRLGHDSTEISRDPLNNNVLMVTAEHGHLAVFELYANKFPRSVQMSNKQGWSPLTAAARYGVTSMVEMVLNLGADLNHRDEEGNTALHHAAAYGHLQTITLLIERGSSATIKNNGGWTAVDFAYSDKVSAHMEGPDSEHSVGLTDSAVAVEWLANASLQRRAEGVLDESQQRASVTDPGHDLWRHLTATCAVQCLHSKMMANKRVSYSSDGDGQDYDPIDNYGSASDYEEEPHPQQGLHPIALDKHDSHHNHFDDSDHDEVHSLKSHVQVIPGVHPSSVALPESPVSTRGRDSFLERSVRSSNPPSPVSSRGQSSYTFESRLSVNSVKRPTVTPQDENHSPATLTPGDALALAKETTLIDDPRNSWEENDSDDASYPAAAYDYGQESESSEEDEYEERPRSHQQQQPHQHTVQEAQTHQEKEHAYEQDLSDYSEDEYDHQPKAHAPVQSDEQPEAFYDDFGEQPPNPNMFSAAADHRASIHSAKSFSSHTKHHSFGYEDRQAAQEEPSESESESSESEPEQPFVPAPSSHPASSTPPPIPAKSRPTSAFSLASLSTPGSPVHTRAMAAPVAEHVEVQEEPAPLAAVVPMAEVVSAPSALAAVAAATAAATAPAAPAAPAASPLVPEPTADTLVLPQSPLIVDTVSQKSTSSASSLDQRQKRYSSGSDTSGTSIDLHSPTTTKNLKTVPPNAFTRSLSNASMSRESNNSLEKQRPISYATVFSDAELNDVNLMDEPLNEQRASVVVPRTPVTPSGFGFPSSFFGGARSHPIAQQQQHQLQKEQTTDQQTQSVAAAAPTPVVPPSPTETRARSTSISAIASSIQGAAFSRGFSSQSQPPVPPLPRTPSQISQRASNVGASPAHMALDRRFSSNRSNASDRASTISNMTNDSNMDLLLARLEAQNELLVKDSKRRATTESEMDRAIGHAKEESAGEDVDWDYWGALMHDYNAVVKRNPKQLTTMIQKGVPSALRGLIWQLLAKSKDTQLEATYAELLKSTSSHEKQITRDMSRTFPNHEYFQADGVGQEALFNVVKAYSLYDIEVGYCQGLSFVVGPLLLNMPDEEAFCMLVRMMSNYEMRGHYTPDMSTLQLRLYQFEQLMEETIPLVYKHLRNQGIRSTMYASQWFMTLFAYKFPLELVFRVYDIILVEGIESMLRFAIALLKINHDKILGLDFEVLIEFLKNGLFEPYMNDAGLFIQDAYNVKVTPKRLAQYAQKYQAMIQKQQAELAAEESLRESNRQLSAHVRRMEGSLHQLNKEHVDLAKELITRKVEMAELQDQNDVLTQKVSDLTRIVDSQAKEVEEQYKGEIEDVLRKNMEYLRKNEQLEDQLSYMESLLVETKMKYAESEIERDNLSRKLSDMRKALGMA